MDEQTKIRLIKVLSELSVVYYEDPNKSGSAASETRDNLPEEGNPLGGSAEQHDDPRDKNCFSTGLQEAVLPEGCSPVEWITLRWETVSSHRNLGCPHEGECLEYAGRRRWQGMSCKKCLVFRERKAAHRKGSSRWQATKGPENTV